MKDIVSFKIIDKLFKNEKQTFLGWKQGNLFKGIVILLVVARSVVQRTVSLLDNKF